MKKLALLSLSILFLNACKKELPKDYVTLSGKITHKIGTEISIKNRKNKVIKTIKIADDGTFSDTLKVTKGTYVFSDGSEYAKLFLLKDSNLFITLDTEKFDETLKFKGRGSNENNYTIKKLLLQEAVFENPDKLYNLSKEDFLVSLDSLKIDFQNLLKAQKNLDAEFVTDDQKDTEGLMSYLAGKYDDIIKQNKLIGKASPTFTNYENHDGTTTSLADLKGKYVYIDVWATWCRPCLGEIPALKELEKELGDKMHFVSISVDKEDKHEAWKKMVADKELKGVQLYANNNWNATFIRDFGINSIPRFILIDPQGNVVKPDASRPSNPETAILLKSLLK